eukprot:Platyproteum_vivax@DN95_c0_g1_i1.p1
MRQNGLQLKKTIIRNWSENMERDFKFSIYLEQHKLLTVSTKPDSSTIFHALSMKMQYTTTAALMALEMLVIGFVNFGLKKTIVYKARDRIMEPRFGGPHKPGSIWATMQYRCPCGSLIKTVVLVKNVPNLEHVKTWQIQDDLTRAILRTEGILGAFVAINAGGNEVPVDFADTDNNVIEVEGVEFGQIIDPKFAPARKPELLGLFVKAFKDHVTHMSRINASTVRIVVLKYECEMDMLLDMERSVKCVERKNPSLCELPHEDSQDYVADPKHMILDSTLALAAFGFEVINVPNPEKFKKKSQLSRKKVRGAIPGRKFYRSVALGPRDLGIQKFTLVGKSFNFQNAKSQILDGAFQKEELLEFADIMGNAVPSAIEEYKMENKEAPVLSTDGPTILYIFFSLNVAAGNAATGQVIKVKGLRPRIDYLSFLRTFWRNIKKVFDQNVKTQAEFLVTFNEWDTKYNDPETVGALCFLGDSIKTMTQHNESSYALMKKLQEKLQKPIGRFQRKEFPLNEEDDE